jgi:predicted nucleotidyltransferase
MVSMDTWKIAQQIIDAISDMNPRRVIVFGSAVDGTVGGDRDLDIAVVFDELEQDFDRLQTKLAIRRRIRPVNAEVAIDLIVYTESEYQRLAPIRSFLRSEILERGTVVYEKAG